MVPAQASRTRLSRVAAVSTLLGFLIGSAAQPAVAQTGPAPVSVAPAIEQEVSLGRTFVGTVVPLRISTIGSAVDGRVVALLVEEGDRVGKDQPLAQLRTNTLEIQLASARAELQLREQELAELENGSRPQEIEQARARLAGFKALMEYWNSKLDRTRDLFERGTATEEELEEVVSSSTKAAQDYREAKAALELTEEGPRQERIEQARARVSAQQEEIRRLEDLLKKHTLRAPFDGYVVTEHTELGQWVSEGDPVVEIVELDRVDIEVPVLEDFVRSVEVGMPARVEIGALPGQVFTGQVALVVPRADVRSRSFPVKVRVDNQRTRGSVLLKAGMFARVTFAVGGSAMAVLVPKDALVLGGETRVVFAFEPDPDDPKQGRVRRVPVELGVASGEFIQVKAALNPGEQVVVEGNERLRPGQEVQVTRTLGTDTEPLKAAGPPPAPTQAAPGKTN